MSLCRPVFKCVLVVSFVCYIYLFCFNSVCLAEGRCVIKHGCVRGETHRQVFDIIAAPLLAAQFVVCNEQLIHLVPRSHVIQADVRNDAA